MKKIALITDARSILGFELTKLLLQENWNVIILDPLQLPFIDPIINNAFENGYLKQYITDLSDFEKLEETLNEIKINEPYLDIIFNNAESKSGSLQFSPQKREIDFEINTVVPYFILMQMKPLLEKGNFRTIINTSSKASLKVKSFNPHYLENPSHFYKTNDSYSSSKLALSIWTKGIAPQLLKKSNIKIRSVDTGSSKTLMSNVNGMPWFIKVFRPFVFSCKTNGAHNLYEAAFGKFQYDSGAFIVKGKDTPIKFLRKADILIGELDFIYTRTFNKINLIY